MSAAKVTLSPKELELVNNADWILTKNHLILKGKFLAQYGPSIDRYFQLYGKYGVETKDWFIGIAQDPWQHHFEKDNYASIQDWNGYSVTMLPFLKLAKKIPLEEWDDIETFMMNHFKKMLTILTDY